MSGQAHRPVYRLRIAHGHTRRGSGCHARVCSVEVHMTVALHRYLLGARTPNSSTIHPIRAGGVVALGLAGKDIGLSCETWCFPDAKYCLPGVWVTARWRIMRLRQTTCSKWPDTFPITAAYKAHTAFPLTTRAVLPRSSRSC